MSAVLVWYAWMMSQESQSLMKSQSSASSNTISTGIYVIRRRQLIELLEAAAEENRFDFVNDILVRYKNVKKIYGYKINSYWNNIADIDAYFKTNMDFLRPDVRSYFFREEPTICSKVDDLPLYQV